MRNNYLVNGDTVEIFLNRGISTKVSACKLEKLKAFNVRWYAYLPKDSETYYVQAVTNVNGKATTVQLSRYLTDADPNKVVDHRNHDTLNNTDDNLRVVSHFKNMQNLKRAKNNKSGYRGVSEVITKGKSYGYVAAIMANGTRHRKHGFNTPIEAAKYLAGYCKTHDIPYPHNFKDVI